MQQKTQQSGEGPEQTKPQRWFAAAGVETKAPIDVARARTSTMSFFFIVVVS
jgi:hypothetical protein